MTRTKTTLKHVACLAVLALLLLPLAAAAAPAASASWNGWITDEACGAAGNKADHKACAAKCLEKGSKLVLFNNADQKLYKLDKQDVAKQHIGYEVTVKGTMTGDTIAVASIAPAPAAK